MPGTRPVVEVTTITEVVDGVNYYRPAVIISGQTFPAMAVGSIYRTEKHAEQVAKEYTGFLNLLIKNQLLRDGFKL